MRKIGCVGHYQKRVGALLQKLKKKEKRLVGRGRLADARVDQLKNYAGVAICQKVGEAFNLHCFMLLKIKTISTIIHIALLVWIVVKI